MELISRFENLNKRFSFLNRKSIVGIILAIISVVVGCIWLKWYVGVAYGFVFLISGFVKMDIKAVKWKYILNLIWGFIIIFVAFRATFLVLQPIKRANITPLEFLMNMVCVLIICAIPFFITTNWKKAVAITTLFLMILSTVNGFIYQFRGKEFGPMDFWSIRTAMNVADQYKIKITSGFVTAWLSWLSVIFMQFSLPALPKIPKAKTRIATVIAEGLLVVLLLVGTSDMTVKTWKYEGTRLNGYYLNFFLCWRDAFVKKPENYSPQKVEEYAKNYVTPEGEKRDTPNVIVIMNESYADFNIFNNKLKTNKPVTPFMDSFTENTIKGYALSSVFGGNTANSEFEFLTGHSMAWLPTNSVPYQQYLNEGKIFTLTWAMKKMGYRCFATHPYLENGWSRKRIYPDLGFDEITFYKDYPMKKKVRKYISDQEMFEYVMDKLKTNESGKPLFLFGVTMQNHGGYDYKGDNYKEEIHLEGYSKNYPKATQYLNVCNKTDEALEYLITELKNYPEDTIVLFYGDHFPKLEEEFYEELHGKSFDTLEEQILQYKIPFVIWANFDIPDQTVECTSINYLSRYLLEAAGIELTPYHQYLKDAEEIIPAMNAMGYYSLQKDKFITTDEAEGKEAEWLEKHSILQYNNIFDIKNRNNKFFGQYIG